MINRDGENLGGGDAGGEALRGFIEGSERERSKRRLTREAIERELLKLGATREDLTKPVAVLTLVHIFNMPAGYVVGADPVEALEAWQADACRFPLELKNRKPPEFVLAYLRKHAREPDGPPNEPGDAPKRASSDTFTQGAAEPSRDEAEAARAARQEARKNPAR